MTRHSNPIAPGGLVADKPGMIGSTARGWSLLRQLLADRWKAETPHDVARLWREAQHDTQLPIGMRVRAATALDPVR